MMNHSRYRVLLLVAVALGIAQVGLIPLLKYQEEQRIALLLLTQRLDRAERLIERKDAILDRSSRLSAALQDTRSRFPVAGSSDEYRLQAQQQISALAQDSGVLITVFDVLLDGMHSDANLGFVRIRLQLQGGLNRLAHFQGKLEGEFQNASLSSVTINSSMPLSAPVNATVQATVIADLFFTPAQGTGS